MDVNTDTQQCLFGTATLADLKHWLETLPRTDYDEYFDKLSDVCNEMSHLKINLPLALQLLDEIRFHLHRHCTKLSHHYLHQSIDLPPSISKTAQQANQLWSVLGDAFMAHIEQEPGIADKISDGELIKPQKAAITFLHRAIYCQQQILLQNILLYRSDTKNQWQTMHQRYALSALHNINEHRINDPINQERPISCITDLYASICLLRVCNCNQLNQLEILNLWQFMQKFSVMIELKVDGESPYSVDLKSDLPPIRTQYLPINGGTLTLSYHALIEEIGKVHAGEQSDISLNKRLRNHTLRALSGEVSRTLPRHISQNVVQIAFGLHNSWLAFSHRRSLDGMTHHLNHHENTLADGENIYLKAKRESFLKDDWNGIYDKKLSNQANFESEAIMAEIKRSQIKEENTDTTEPTLFDAGVVEHSATGFCLKMSLPVPTPLQNGELVVLREQHDDMYVIGAVRWVRSETKNIIFGLEIISPSASCFGARMIPNKGNIKDERFSQCLLLPAIPALKLQPRVLLPSIPFMNGGKLQLLRDEYEIIIKLVENEQSSFSYSVFSFDDLDDIMNLIPTIGERLKSNDQRLGSLFV